MFFKRKKKSLPDLPELPKLPELEEEKIPSYEPIRKMSIEKPVLPTSTLQRRSLIEEGKPLFVKIKKYKEAIKIIGSIKEKLNETETILSNLKKIKAQEDEELENWHRDILDIKEKLLDADKTLFEV